MESQVPKLEQYYKKSSLHQIEEDSDGDDFLNDGEYWEFQHPEKVECWSLLMIPFIEKICFCVKFFGTEAFIPLSYEERIKDVVEDIIPTIKIHCITTLTGLPDAQQYNFTIHFDSTKIPFRVTPKRYNWT